MKTLRGRLAMTVGISVLVIAGLFSWPKIKKMRAQSRIDELLPEFEQISDRFTRPKVYAHKSFKDITGEGQPKHFVSKVRAYSDGRLRMPEIIPQEGNHELDWYYVADVNLNEKIFDLYSRGDLEGFLNYATSVTDKDGISLAIRIRTYNSKKISNGEYTVQGEELAAFMKTMELTHLFKATSE